MKLVTWNTQWCCGLDGRVSVERIVDGARALADFDVLCLQEIAIGYPGLAGNAGHDQPALLRALLPGFEVHFGATVQERGRDGHWQQFGNLVASRLPALQVQHHPLPYPADAAEGGVRSMPRMCTVATLQAAFGPLRVMTTHLEYYSAVQRMAQARALRALHAQACAQAAMPPLLDESGGPFQSKVHTASALLCGDFNLAPTQPEYALLQEADAGATRLVDAWHALHGSQPHDPTFRLFDRTYGPEPLACDFVFVSDDLAPRVRRMAVDLQTQASDHQPVLVELAD